MTIEYFLAPNARWQGRDETGQPIIGGFLFTWLTQTRIPKATYSDPSGMNANPNPVILDGKGEANIYWADDEFYDIELYTHDGQLVYTQSNYPFVSTSGGGPITVVQDNANLIRNPQFTYWNNTTEFEDISKSSNRYDYIADDWVFDRSNLNATIDIDRGVFSFGQPDVVASPINYLHYESKNAGGGGETFKYVGQYIKSVKSLANTEVSIAFYAKSSSSSTISISLEQYFGSGGSPSVSVNTIALTQALSPTWERFEATVTLPSISGKTPGTDGNDALIFRINLPLNQTAVVDVANVQLQANNAATDFPYSTPNDQYKCIDSQIDDGVFKTGDIKKTLRLTADNGWVLCDESTIGNSASGASIPALKTKALFELIWNNVDNAYVPILDSGGMPTTRGATAQDDYNADKRMTLTKSLGRVLAGYSDLLSHPIGSYVGEEKHLQAENEVGRHRHPLETDNYTAWKTDIGGTPGTDNVGTAKAQRTDYNLEAKDQVPFNIMQPTVYVNVMIKL